MIYGIEVGRWTGIFSPLYYADIFIDGEDAIVYHTFNSFTKKGALKRAKKYIDRISRNNDSKQIYTYDVTTHKLEKII